MRRAVGIAYCIAALVGSAVAPARAQEPGELPARSPDAGDPPRVAPVWPGQAPRPATSLLPRPDLPGGGPYFYMGLGYGSDALIHPARLILDGGLGTLQFDNRTNRPADLRIAHGWERLWADLGSPIETIRQTRGWNRFLRAEVIPLKVSREDGQYWPNYTLHLVGGGMSHRMMHEWYEQHGYRHPGIAAGATIGVYHLLNEVVEAESRIAPSTDAIADLMIFDPLGVWLFSHEPVARFFSRRLNLRDWSGQPALDPTTGAVENISQDYSIKVSLPGTERWSFFYYFGNHGEAGLSFRRADGSAISVGAGLRAKSLVNLGDGVETVDLIPSAGIFYDRNGSLMGSLTMVKSSRYNVRVNAYPGLVRIGRWSPGLFVLFSRNGDTVAGVHFRQLPLGLAFHR